MGKVIVSLTFKRNFSDVRLKLSLNSNMSNSFYSTSFSTKNKVAKIKLENLNYNTQYFYRTVVNGVEQSEGNGQFKTAPIGVSNFTCAFASCAYTGSNHEVFETIRNLNPNFFIHLGDIHYEDISVNDKQLFHNAYDSVFSSVRQSKLYSEIPTVYIWDDHDYGSDNSTSNSPSREAAIMAYRERVPHHELAIKDGVNPIYHSFVYGRVRFIVTDTRSMKTNDDVLGQEQENWFYSELLKPEPFKVWINTIPYIAASANDTWGHSAGVRSQRTRIANFIKNNGLEGHVAIISGDMHAIAIDDGTNSDYATGGGAKIPVFQAAPLNQADSAKGGPYTSGVFRNVAPARGDQYGIMNVIDDGQEITIEWIGKRGIQTLTSHTFRVGDLFIPPTPISPVTNLQYSALTETTVSLSWNASSSANIVGYQVIQNGVLLNEIVNTSYDVSELSPSTNYTFTIKAKDSMGTLSDGVSVEVATLDYKIIVEDSYYPTFNGTSSYGMIPHHSELDGLSEFTIELWMKPLSAPSISSSVILMKTTSSGSTTSVTWGFNYDALLLQPEFRVNGNSRRDLKSGQPLTIGKWHHIVGTYSVSSNSMRIYIDGILTNSATAVGMNAPNASNNIWLSGTSSSRHINSSFQNIRFWNRALSEAEVQVNADNRQKVFSGAENGLSFFWNLNEGVGDIIYDNSSKNNHGQLFNTTWTYGS